MYRRLLNAGFGALLVLAGIAMLVLPGPGLLAIAAGAALMLSQWPAGRRVLARIRLRMRQRYGSSRVRSIESRIPDEVCPDVDTTQLRVLAETPPPPETTPPPDPAPPAAAPPDAPRPVAAPSAPSAPSAPQATGSPAPAPREPH